MATWDISLRRFPKYSGAMISRGSCLQSCMTRLLLPTRVRSCPRWGNWVGYSLSPSGKDPSRTRARVRPMKPWQGHPISPHTFNPSDLHSNTSFPTSLCIADPFDNFPMTQLWCLCTPSAHSNFTTLWLYDLPPFSFIYLHFLTYSFVDISSSWLCCLHCYSNFHCYLY